MFIFEHWRHTLFCGSVGDLKVFIMKKTNNSGKKELQFNVLRILEQKPKISQRQLAEKVNVSLGAVNYCLHALAEKGLIKFERFSFSNNKKGYLYMLTPSGLHRKGQLTVSFLKRKLIEYDALQNEITELRKEIKRK